MQAVFTFWPNLLLPPFPWRKSHLFAAVLVMEHVGKSLCRLLSNEEPSFYFLCPSTRSGLNPVEMSKAPRPRGPHLLEPLCWRGPQLRFTVRHGSSVIHAPVQERLKHIRFSVCFTTKFRFRPFLQFCFHKYQLVCSPECVSETLLCFHHPFTRAHHVSNHSSKFTTVKFKPSPWIVHSVVLLLQRLLKCNQWL